MTTTERRVAYRFRGKVRWGAIVGYEQYPDKPFYYIVKNDASGTLTRVLPQWIVGENA